MDETVTIEAGEVGLADWRRVLAGAQVRIADTARPAVERGRATIDELVRGGEAIYGVNTGFGKFAQVRIGDDRLIELQRNLILSHSVGTGPLLDDSTVRLVMAMKAAALAQGHSGVRWTIIERLVRLVNAGIFPCIPAKGSVGASGDLAPLAHMTVALMGLGEMRHEGTVLPASEGLARASLDVLELAPKEALALINGTQVSTALALEGLFAAEDILRAALVTGALTVDACKGADVPFDPRIHALRRQRGQQAVAAVYRRLLEGSGIRASHLDCNKVQDPYCLRCQPQVMGACLDQIGFAADVLAREANAVSDNPLIFPDTGEALSGGNFHAEPVAMAADVLALAIAETGSLSERRQALMMDAGLSGLPQFLTREGGLNSGFMMAQVTTAALASENKALAHPASVDSIPTSANQEDHVSMATYAARRLGEMTANARTIVAIEWLAAAQGIDFHAPLETSPPLTEAVRRLRARVPHLEQDRYFAPDIEAARDLLAAGALDDLVAEPIGPSHSSP